MEDEKDENKWRLGEIAANALLSRRGFQSGLVIGWLYDPAWINDPHNHFPAHYEAVSPGELANLFRSSVAPPQRQFQDTLLEETTCPLQQKRSVTANRDCYSVDIPRPDFMESMIPLMCSSIFACSTSPSK